FTLPPSFVRTRHNPATAPPFLVEVAPCGTVAVVREISLIARNDPAFPPLRAELDSAVAVPQFDLGDELEVRKRLLVDKKCILLGALPVCRAGDGAALHFPETWIAIPAVERSAVEHFGPPALAGCP